MTDGTKPPNDWNDAHKQGFSAKDAADNAWQRFDASTLAMTRMDEGLTDNEIRVEFRGLVDEGSVLVGDLPNLAKLRKQWEKAGRKAKPRPTESEQAPETKHNRQPSGPE